MWNQVFKLLEEYGQETLVLPEWVDEYNNKIWPWQEAPLYSPTDSEAVIRIKTIQIDMILSKHMYFDTFIGIKLRNHCPKVFNLMQEHGYYSDVPSLSEWAKDMNKRNEGKVNV